MIYTVSTVKDTFANVTRFVEGNLSAGADLMFVFSEDLTEETSEYLSNHELVIHVPATASGGHWNGNRPDNIYARQNINANLARTLLSAFPWASWLFHIDGDEILDIDRDELESLAPDVRAVRLTPLESVAATKGDWEGYFKYRLSKPNLALLYALEAIPEPNLKAFYNGHTAGKVGIRPSLDYWIGIHTVKVGEETLRPYSSSGFRMLHYDSYNIDEFVRKWVAKIANAGAAQRSARRTIRMAIEATTQLTHLPDERRAQLLTDIYTNHIADDVDLLYELGFLTQVDETRHKYSPRRHSPEQLDDLRHLLQLLREEDLSLYNPRSGLGAQQRALQNALTRAGEASENLGPLANFVDRLGRRGNKKDAP